MTDLEQLFKPADFEFKVGQFHRVGDNFIRIRQAIEGHFYGMKWDHTYSKWEVSTRDIATVWKQNSHRPC